MIKTNFELVNQKALDKFARFKFSYYDSFVDLKFVKRYFRNLNMSLCCILFTRNMDPNLYLFMGIHKQTE